MQNNFGVGYTLTIEKKPDADANRIQHFVLKRLPEAKVSERAHRCGYDTDVG